MAAGENIIAQIICIEAAVCDGGIYRNPGACKQSRSANAIRDPICVSASGSSHNATLNLKAARIAIRGNARAHDIGKLSCGHDTALGRCQSKHDSNIMCLDDEFGVGEVASCIRRRGNVPW